MAATSQAPHHRAAARPSAAPRRARRCSTRRSRASSRTATRTRRPAAWPSARASRAAPTCTTSRPARRWWRPRWSISPSAAASICSRPPRSCPRAASASSQGLDLLWSGYASPLYQAALDLWTHARTDPELRERLARGRARPRPRRPCARRATAVRRARRAARLRSPDRDGDGDDARPRAARHAAPGRRAQPPAVALLPRAARRDVRDDPRNATRGEPVNARAPRAGTRPARGAPRPSSSCAVKAAAALLLLCGTQRSL